MVIKQKEEQNLDVLWEDMSPQGEKNETLFLYWSVCVSGLEAETFPLKRVQRIWAGKLERVGEGPARENAGLKSDKKNPPFK